MIDLAMKEHTVAFLGLGLISGSLASALKAAEWQAELIAWGPRLPSLERGRDLGLIDRFSLCLKDVISQADIVVIGAPPVATANLLPEVLELAANARRPAVTDIASVKELVVNAVCQKYDRFVPGHPIAGSEQSGVASAHHKLFRGREVILTPLDNTDNEAVKCVEAIWDAAGARITMMSASEHDATLAASSHLPHLIAYALTAMLGDDELEPMKHGGGALRDMTRTASSDPRMWREIVINNQKPILQVIDTFSDKFANLRGLIASADREELDLFFSTCRHLRRDYDEILNPSQDDLEKVT